MSHPTGNRWGTWPGASRRLVIRSDPPARPWGIGCGEASTDCRQLAAHTAGVGVAIDILSVAIGIVGVVFRPRRGEQGGRYPRQPECPTRIHATMIANKC